MTARAALFATVSLVLVVSVVTVMGQESAPPGTKIAPLPRPGPGSWWALRVWGGDLGSVERVERLAHREHGKLMILAEDREARYTPEWHLLEEAYPGAGVWVTYAPALPLHPFPLWEGKRWTSLVTVTTEGWLFVARSAVPVQGEAKGWEWVEVPAGKFHALRLEIRAGLAQVTCWYAIEAQHAVKCLSLDRLRYNFDLTAFQLHQGEEPRK